MADASNPVMSADRLTLKQLKESAVQLERQNLSKLRELLETTDRVYLPVGEQIIPDELVEDYLKTLLERMENKTKIENGELSLSFLKTRGEMQASELEFNNKKIHPAQTNIKKSIVTTVRQFGQIVPPGKDIIRSVLRFVDFEVVQETVESIVYSLGTAEGFSKRLKMLCDRKAVISLGKHGGRRGAGKVLSKVLPLKTELPDWHDFEQLLELVKVTKSAGAGAPYWKPKSAALEECVFGVLPLIVDAINAGTLNDLYKKDPELFLCECKNKKDRYKVGQLREKTRPYFAYPFHWSLLFSMLCQPFVTALHIFTTDPDSVNAYGYSYAHGGGNAFVEYMKNVGEKECKYVVYGDDIDIYYKRKGILYRVSPDCVQMDGSVDYDTVSLAVDYVLKSYEVKWGKSSFWKVVGAWWKVFATSPEFLVHGTTVYTKGSKNGLCSGVTGTTYFDNVKAILAYEDLRNVMSSDADIFFNPTRATLYLKQHHGLEIKTGTWHVTEVHFTDELGPLNENKFLGTRISKRYNGEGEMVYTPSLTVKEWMVNVLVPREELGFKGSETAKQRIRFDRARGLLVTGAIFEEPVKNALYDYINRLPSLALAMRVQDGGGMGMTPTDQHLVIGEDFMYPSSEGVPTEEWVTSLYGDPEVKGEWLTLFPDIFDDLGLFRKNKKKMGTYKEVLVEGVQTLQYEESPYFQPGGLEEEELELPNFNASTSFAKAVSPLKQKPETHKPSFRDAVRNLEEEIADRKIVSVKVLENEMGRTVAPIVVQSEKLHVVEGKVMAKTVAMPGDLNISGVVYLVPGTLHVHPKVLVKYKYVEQSVQANATAWVKNFIQVNNITMRYETLKEGPSHLLGVKVHLYFNEEIVATVETQRAKEAKLLLTKAAYLGLRWLASHFVIPTVDPLGKEAEPPGMTLSMPFREKELPEGLIGNWSIMSEPEELAAFSAASGVKEV